MRGESQVGGGVGLGDAANSFDAVDLFDDVDHGGRDEVRPPAAVYHAFAEFCALKDVSAEHRGAPDLNASLFEEPDDERVVRVRDVEEGVILRTWLTQTAFRSRSSIGTT